LKKQQKVKAPKAVRSKKPKLTVRLPDVHRSPHTLGLLLRRQNYFYKKALKLMSDKKFPQWNDTISGHLEAVLTKESGEKHPGQPAAKPKRKNPSPPTF